MKNKKPTHLLWEELWNSESPNANWEIWNGDAMPDGTIIDNDVITLHYVPEDDYSEKDIKIRLPFKHFVDLINFMKKLGKKVQKK